VSKLIDAMITESDNNPTMLTWLTRIQKINPEWFGRAALAVVYVWFGAVKLVGLSAATPLVSALFDRTLAWLLPFSLFFALFSLGEVVLGFSFMFPRLDRVTRWLFLAHMLTTMAPLVLLPEFAWESFLVPTLEGQYILKNLCLLALGWFIWGSKVSRFPAAKTTI
jgi:uncharacterized membrane protein YkgB